MSVLGPPGPPAGVFGDGVTATSISLSWQNGAENGRPIRGYVVEGFNEHEQVWRELKTSKTSSALSNGDERWRGAGSLFIHVLSMLCVPQISEVRTWSRCKQSSRDFPPGVSIDSESEQKTRSVLGNQVLLQVMRSVDHEYESSKKKKCSRFSF